MPGLRVLGVGLSGPWSVCVAEAAGTAAQLLLWLLTSGRRMGGADCPVRLRADWTWLCNQSGVGRDRPAEQGAMAGEIIGRREELLALKAFLEAVPAGGQAL